MSDESDHTTSHIMGVLADHIEDVQAGWSVGTFGAIAEFTRDPDEPARLERAVDRISVVTDKGGLQIVPRPGLRLIASEIPTSESWSHRIALCLPESACAMSGRTTLTEIGPDEGALRAQDRTGILFDLGLGTLQIDACVRVNNQDVVAALRTLTGKPVFESGNDVMSIMLAANPHRIYVSRVGRAEVFQPIPAPGGRSPDGPHTHLLPKLLAHGRTYAATEPIPEGWIPCAHIYPAHPLRDQLGCKRAGFLRDHHVAFQKLLDRHGVPELVALKREVVAAATMGHGPETLRWENHRFARATVRVALRQLSAMELGHPALAQWLAVHDRQEPDPENPSEFVH